MQPPKTYQEAIFDHCAALDAEASNLPENAKGYSRPILDRFMVKSPSEETVKKAQDQLQIILNEIGIDGIAGSIQAGDRIGLCVFGPALLTAEQNKKLPCIFMDLPVAYMVLDFRRHIAKDLFSSAPKP